MHSQLSKVVVTTTDVLRTYVDSNSVTGPTVHSQLSKVFVTTTDVDSDSVTGSTVHLQLSTVVVTTTYVDSDSVTGGDLRRKDSSISHSVRAATRTCSCVVVSLKVLK